MRGGQCRTIALNADDEVGHGYGIALKGLLQDGQILARRLAAHIVRFVMGFVGGRGVPGRVFHYGRRDQQCLGQSLVAVSGVFVHAGKLGQGTQPQLRHEVNFGGRKPQRCNQQAKSGKKQDDSAAP